MSKTSTPRSLLDWFSPKGSTSEDLHDNLTATSYSPDRSCTDETSASFSSSLESLSAVSDEQRSQPVPISEDCNLDGLTVVEQSSNACTASLLPESPNQPILSFPMRVFGSQQRAFCASWYKKYSWLHYQENSDNVLCFYCCVAERRGLLLDGNKDDAFTKLGFSNWKKALLKFEKHQHSVCHRKAMEVVINIPKFHANVGEMLSSSHAHQKAVNRQMLKIILSSIRYLGRQGLALRGRYKTASETVDERGELDSNLFQLLKTRSEDNPQLKKWLQRTQDKFTSPDIQNEILSLMALRIVRDIASELSGQWFTIMVDETTDLSNIEQLVFCIRYVDDCLNVHEYPVGLYSLESTSADSIMTTIQDILLRMNLRISNCRGQCYDGASNMSGAKSGVCTKIRQLESRALYTHCYGHALNLATQDALKGIQCMEATLDTVHEITKLIKKSPKREVIFKQTKGYVTPGSPGIRTLCPTRWTVRAEALTSIIENYEPLQSTWLEARSATKDTEMRSRIGGVDAQMQKFEFYFGLELGRKVLHMVDNLSKALQSQTMSACEGQKMVNLTLSTVQSIRNDKAFDLFWEYIESKRLLVDIAPPTLPRKRKAPERYQIGESNPEHPSTAKDHYRRIYFEAIDLSISSIKNRFEQQGFQMLQKLETLLTTHPLSSDSEVVKDVFCFYGDDLHTKDRLLTQLHAMHTGNERPLNDVGSVVSYLKSLNSASQGYFSEVVKVVKLILVSPATNAVSERSFSALRRLKNWLRTTISQTRLNWCMILHIHKDRTDSLDMDSVANDFVSQNSSRVNIFGTF